MDLDLPPLHFPPGIYTLVDRRPVACDDYVVWGRWLEDDANVQVALSERGDLTVSTIFLGITQSRADPSPKDLFETAVFRRRPRTFACQKEPRTLVYSARTDTWEQAEEQHAIALALCDIGFLAGETPG